MLLLYMNINIDTSIVHPASINLPSKKSLSNINIRKDDYYIKYIKYKSKYIYLKKNILIT